MKVRRTFLIQVAQVWEGEPSPDWDMGDLPFAPAGIYSLNDVQDQYVTDTWRLVSEDTDLVSDDQLVSAVLP